MSAQAILAPLLPNTTMTQFLPDLIHLSDNLGSFYSLGFLCFFSLLISLNLFCTARKNTHLEKRLFWVFASFLVTFSALRPMGIARDDLAGYVGWSSKICPFTECLQPIQSTRDWAWYFLVSILNSFMSSERAVLVLSGIGTLTQLFIISRFCHQKLLALALFIPLTYLYYDFTLLRAGSALTLFFIGLYFMVHSKKLLGSGILLGNYLFHTQGIFSIGVLPFSWIAKYKYISIALILCLIGCIYLQWTPPLQQLTFLSKNETQFYWGLLNEGIFSKERLFPIADLLIIAYLIFILAEDKTKISSGSIQQYALGSILLGVFLAWFFAPIHAAQTRLFDFYAAPLVFLAGNLKLNKINLFATLGLAILLYARMELIHNWILG